jgi:hypothetical protein
MQKKYIFGSSIGIIVFTCAIFGYTQLKQKPILQSSVETLQQSLIQAASIARPSVVGVFSEQENSYALEDKQ